MDCWRSIGILLKIGIVVGITQGAVAYLILVERKIAAWAQDRLGPEPRRARSACSSRWPTGRR